MILKDFYTEKKNALETEFSTQPAITASIHLFSETVFKNTISTPVVMLKYDSIAWESSSEKTYKADTTFSVYLVLPKSSPLSETSYLNAFEIARRIDKAIFSKSNNPAIDTNSTFKVQEKQWTNDNDNWEKNDYFIWQLTYKTTLIENTLKKKYRLIYNGSTESEITALGYNLTNDFIELHEQPIKGKLFVNTNAPTPKEASILTDLDLDDDGITDDTIIAEDFSINIPSTESREIKSLTIDPQTQQ